MMFSPLGGYPAEVDQQDIREESTGAQHRIADKQPTRSSHVEDDLEIACHNIYVQA